MSKRAWSILLTLWMLSLVAVAAIAQTPEAVPKTGDVLAGQDIGFLVKRFDGARPVGVLVVRVHGTWIEPKSELKPRPLTSP